MFPIPYGKANLIIPQGADFYLPIYFGQVDGTPIDLTGFSARMQVRETVAATAVLLGLTSDTDGGIEFTDRPAGKFRIHLTAAQTAAMTWTRGVYDVELVSSGGEVTRLLLGDIKVSREVTR